MAELLYSLQVGDENAALGYVHDIISEASQQGILGSILGRSDTAENNDNLSWMAAILWKATWLNMPVSLLLENKTPADILDNIVSRFPSQLYLASYLGHTSVVCLLLQHGTNIGVLREGKYGVCWVAAARGHANGVRALVESNRELLEKEAPETPLYAASFHGCWKAIKTLISLKATPDLRKDKLD
ncbi:uncharacterized protein N7479_002681 [Penicillium vulpinum]|uniref:uncharacterized protein n=1 Tax=Penicillium vulpinum TaxID=29845 RepID=UPI002547C2D6|nr:uncharacterized protein N7479_002681 [Penicillium vulpinum]KAJ5972763.1 hypothetical protein N7479_002681 [Penicillium vulpinum]